MFPVKIGTEALQVAHGDGKDGRVKDPDHVSCFTGPDSGTLSLTIMTHGLQLSVSFNLNTQRLYALLTSPTENKH